MAYARQLPDKDCPLAERYTRSFNYPEKSCLKTKADLKRLGIKTFFASNVCCAYDREKFWFQGGFIQNAIFNEDMIFAGKAVMEDDYAIAYVADAKVIHSHNYNCTQQFKRNFDLAVSQADHPEVFGGIHSESEGIRLVKQTARYLSQQHRPWLIPGMFVKSGFKYGKGIFHASTVADLKMHHEPGILAGEKRRRGQTMMTMMLRVILIVVSVITMTFMMRKIRQAKVQIEAAMFWVIMALLLVIFAVVPGVADLCARLLGIYSTPNFLFLFMIFLLIIKAFGMTIQISQLESKQRELIQKMALEQKAIEEKETVLEEREAALETCRKGE